MDVKMLKYFRNLVGDPITVLSRSVLVYIAIGKIYTPIFLTLWGFTIKDVICDIDPPLLYPEYLVCNTYIFISTFWKKLQMLYNFGAHICQDVNKTCILMSK